VHTATEKQWRTKNVACCALVTNIPAAFVHRLSLFKHSCSNADVRAGITEFEWHRVLSKNGRDKYINPAHVFSPRDPQHKEIMALWRTVGDWEYSWNPVCHV
jgi:hypothetical protein